MTLSLSLSSLAQPNFRAPSSNNQLSSLPFDLSRRSRSLASRSPTQFALSNQSLSLAVLLRASSPSPFALLCIGRFLLLQMLPIRSTLILSPKKRKRITGANDYGQSVERAASILADEMKNVGNILSRYISKEGKEEKQMRLYNELQRTTSLSSEELDVATIILVDKPARMNVFFGVPDDKKDG